MLHLIRIAVPNSVILGQTIRA